ncbi:MAG: hypothetical protein IPH73_01665 [Rhodocyclales bacterium]|nr:hypothetical protein [Rhodocyclales bacterium]
MRTLIGRTLVHPALSLGSTLLWGVLEFIALQRSRLAGSGPMNKRRAP